VFEVVIMFMVPRMSARRADMKGSSRFLNQMPTQRSKWSSFEEQNKSELGM